MSKRKYTILFAAIVCLLGIHFAWHSWYLSKNSNVHHQAAYQAYWDSKYPQANIFLIDNDSIIKSQLPDSIPLTEIIAIVFPELLRYDEINNAFERQLMETFYIPYGKTSSDYSLGYFQMKASFLENLESEIQQNESFQDFAFIYTYSSSDSIEIRRERLERTESIAFSLSYLHSFYVLVLHKFPFIKKLPSKERIYFLATAYNRGFHCPESEIRAWFDIINYPNGKVLKYYQPNVGSYGQVAWDFYKLNSK